MNPHVDTDSAFSPQGTNQEIPGPLPQKDGPDHGLHHHSPMHEYSAHNDAPGQEHNHDSAATYLDWASQFLLDGTSNDLLASFDFANSAMPPSNPIMHKIQFQNSVHDPAIKNDAALPYGDHHAHLSHAILSPPSPPMAQMTPLPPQVANPPITPHVSNSPLTSQVSGGVPLAPQVPGPSLAPRVQAPAPSQKTPTGAFIPTPASKEQKPKPRRPCDHCRRKKIRCVIIPNTDNCAQCEAKSLKCTYTRLPSSKDEPQPKRARKSGELNDQAAVNSSTPSIYDIVPPNVPIRTVAPIQDYSTMNNSLLKKTLSLQFPRSSFYIGPTSYLFDTNLLEVIIGSQNKPQGTLGATPGRPATLNKIEQVNLSDKISLRKVENKTQFVLQDDQTKQSIQTMSDDVDAVEKFIAPHGQILIDVYFRIIHPSYPILHKKVFLEKYSRTHREFSAPLLAAVYVLAIQWWDYDPQLNRFPKPNVEHILRIALNNYILEILKRPKLSAVQAGLLLLQCKHILRGINASHAPAAAYGQASASLTSAFNEADYNDWVLCSQVVALAEELGLGLDCDGWKLPKWERGLRKRLAWAVYLEDKWLSLKNSRPSHINDINWVVSDLAEEDFPEKHGDGDLKEGSSDINNGKKNFMNLISLSKILSEILNTLFSMKAMKEITDINEVLRIAKPIQLKLRTWYHSLPIELQMNSVQPRKLCSNGYLQLAYFAAELTLHRKIITTLYQQNIHGSKIPEELLVVCRSAAKTRLIASIEFVKDLKPEHIHSFWHSSASSNFTLIGTFAALLFISSSSKEEAKEFKEKVYDYRWVLKISAKGFVQIGDSLQKLDLVMNHIPGLLNESSEQPITIPNVPTIDYNKPVQQQQQQVPQAPRAPPQQQHQHNQHNQQQIHQHQAQPNQPHQHAPHHPQQQQQQHHQMPKHPHPHMPKQSPLSQHSPQSPSSQQLHNSPQQLNVQKAISQQQQYPKSSPGNDQRPFAQRQNSSGQGMSPYPGNNFTPGNANVGTPPSAGPNPQFRYGNQTPHLPFDPSQAFQGQNFHPQQGNMGNMRNSPMNTQSPQSTSGRSPKDIRPQRASYQKASQSDVGSNHSTPMHGPEIIPKVESAKGSPVLVRSPLAQQHNAQHNSQDNAQHNATVDDNGSDRNS